jgi:hypothetical protein
VDANHSPPLWIRSARRAMLLDEQEHCAHRRAPLPHYAA